MSLFDTAERFASIDRSQVVLNPKRCLYSHNPSSSCAACFEICPAHAITPGKPPVLDSETCQTCLACLPVCPAGAFSADDDVSALLNCVTHLDGKTVELLCGLHPQPETSVSADGVGIRLRGCLAGLGAGAYLLLSAMGLEQIVLRTDACLSCKWVGLLARVEHQAESADQFLAAWNKAGSIVLLNKIDAPLERPIWDVNNPPLSRRDLFRLLARQGQVAIARAVENGVMSSKRQPGRDRMRMLSATTHLPEPASGSNGNLEGFGFATLTISEDCNACGACAKACPTAALNFEKNQENTLFKLTFLTQNCIACDLCMQVCAPAAIALDHSPSFENIFGMKEPVVVETGELTRCERCNSFIAAKPGVHLCTLCEYRREHPFGSILPAELKSKIKKTGEELHS